MHRKCACIQIVSQFLPTRQQFFVRESKQKPQESTNRKLGPGLPEQKTADWPFPSIYSRTEKKQ